MFRLGRTRQNAASPGRLRTARERIDFFQSIRPLNALRPMDHTSFIQFFLFFHFSRCAVHFLLYPVYCNAVIHFLSAIRYFFCVPAHFVCPEPCCLFTLMEDVVLSLCYEFIIGHGSEFVNTF